MHVAHPRPVNHQPPSPYIYCGEVPACVLRVNMGDGGQNICVPRPPRDSLIPNSGQTRFVVGCQRRRAPDALAACRPRCTLRVGVSSLGEGAPGPLAGMNGRTPWVKLSYYNRSKGHISSNSALRCQDLEVPPISPSKKLPSDGGGNSQFLVAELFVASQPTLGRGRDEVGICACVL